MDIAFKAQVCFTYCYIETRNWEFTLSSRAEADDILSNWDAAAVAYQHEGPERCLRLPFLSAFLVRR